MTYPPVVLREQLAADRDRGINFDTAWAHAVKTAVATESYTATRRQWQVAFAGTRDDWRTAFERSGQPSTLCYLTNRMFTVD